MARDVAADPVEVVILQQVTKVTLHYNLLRPLTGEDFDNIASVHGTYGLGRVQPSPALDALTVDYDASRLSKLDVQAVLHRFGLPIAV
jgi:hypothetical protein